MTRYELRTYTLDSEASADAYEEILRRQCAGLLEHGVHIYGIWRPIEERTKIVVLGDLPEGKSPEEFGRAYFGSPAFHAGFAHIDGGYEAFKPKMRGIESTMMTSIPGSPMR